MVGDYNGDSFQLTPNMETESGLGSDDLNCPQFSENVTPHHLKQTAKSRQSPNPSQVVASKIKTKRASILAENVFMTAVSPTVHKKSSLALKQSGAKTLQAQPLTKASEGPKQIGRASITSSRQLVANDLARSYKLAGYSTCQQSLKTSNAKKAPFVSKKPEFDPTLFAYTSVRELPLLQLIPESPSPKKLSGQISQKTKRMAEQNFDFKQI